MRKRSASLVLMIAATTALSGCGGSDSSPASRHPTTDVRSALNGYSVEKSLKVLPDVGANGAKWLIASGSLAGATKVANVPQPHDDAQSKADWSGQLLGATALPVAESLMIRTIGDGATKKTLGFDAANVDSYAAIERGPNDIAVIRLTTGGKLKPGLTKTGSAAVGSREPIVGSDHYLAFPVVHGVAQKGPDVALAATSKVLDAWQKGEGRTMAGRDDLVAVAKSLDEHHVLGAVLTEAVLRPSGRIPDTRVPDYDAVGVGVSIEGGHAVSFVAYFLNGSEDAAERIEKVWRTGIRASVDRPISDEIKVENVWAEGNVVVVKLVPDTPSAALSMLLTSEAPFLPDSFH